MKRLALCSVMFVLSLAVSGCGTVNVQSLPEALRANTPIERLVPQVLAVYPHDPTAYTEGLVWHAGMLYESAGLYGQSSLRQVDPQTGKVLRQVNLPTQYFGEGLALAGNHLVQLTWHEQVAFIYDVNTFAKLGSFSYTGEGWGLCFDGSSFFQDDGSPTISVRDANTFQVTRQLYVTLDGQPVRNLNELECVGGWLYANVWHTDNILRIDKATGRVTAAIDASGLLTAQETAQAGPERVLNGIAYDSQHDTFFITGKLWPWVFDVRFVQRKP